MRTWQLRTPRAYLSNFQPIVRKKAYGWKTSNHEHLPDHWRFPAEIKHMFAFPISVTIPGESELSLHPIWLRENCPCPKCTHPETRQRLIDTNSIPLDINPRSVETNPQEGLKITWEENDHLSVYSWDWLRNHKPTTPSLKFHFRSDAKLVPNDPESFPTVDYSEVMDSDDGVRQWTRKIHVYGFCFVKGCPVTPEATKELLERIAFIRQTHYGGFWDFTSNLELKDMAYTTEGLGVHTDTAYFTDPAGLQMFHLLSHTGGKGGESLLVDGFHAAQTLFLENPIAYQFLNTHVFGHHSSGNKDVCIKSSNEFPTFLHRNSDRELCQVRWNNEDRRASYCAETHILRKWYAAAREWSAILKRTTLERRFQLEPGTPLIFDNWRMLHGRTAFSGERRLCGGYINHDDFMSRYELLNKGREAAVMEV
ncbi:hypothetical protein LOZ58_000484 [Ophidiomyces ophidiicola]|nr:hypothetical protein LOZ58_000484 [Ophidiomyces ophidiicola]